MNIRIKSVEGISLKSQLKIISEYLSLYNKEEIIYTKKNIGIKIESSGRIYHVSCRQAKNGAIFSIWWGI